MNFYQKTYFGSFKKYISTENFNLSLTIHDADSILPKHFHEKPYLSLLVAGMYKEEANNSFTVNSGTILYRNAFYEHANKFSNHQKGICLNIEFKDLDEIMALNENRLYSQEFVRKGSIDLYKLLYLFLNDSDIDLLNILCYESILPYFDKKNMNGKQKWINLVKELINDDPMSNISLHKLSSEFQLHPNYIVRKFKESTGLKLSEYLSKIRLEKSIQELVTSDLTLTEIAIKNGFFDQSHFNKNFRKFLALTPTEYKLFLKRLV